MTSNSVCKRELTKKYSSLIPTISGLAYIVLGMLEVNYYYSGVWTNATEVRRSRVQTPRESVDTVTCIARDTCLGRVPDGHPDKERLLAKFLY
jgi:hypothetical protein